MTKKSHTKETMPKGRVTGRVTRWDHKKGYGFVQPDDGSNTIFVHQSELQMGGYRMLYAGERVEFQFQFDEKDNKIQGVHVTAQPGHVFRAVEERTRRKEDKSRHSRRHKSRSPSRHRRRDKSRSRSRSRSPSRSRSRSRSRSTSQPKQSSGTVIPVNGSASALPTVAQTIDLSNPAMAAWYAWMLQCCAQASPLALTKQ